MQGRSFAIMVAASSAAMFGAVFHLTGPAAQASAEPAPPSSMTEATPAPPATQSSVYYSGCREVRAAGAAPLHRGQPGYRPEIDGDGDGVACEDYGGSTDKPSSGGSRRRRR